MLIDCTGSSVSLREHERRLRPLHILIPSCFSTGGAGLINTIKSFIDGHIVAGIFDTIATVGWGLETLGNLFYYRQVGVGRA